MSQISSTPSPETPGWDERAFLRAAVVVGGLSIILCIWGAIKCYRNSQSSRSRVRKYDIVSSKELQNGLAVDSDSEDDLFGTPSDRQKLVAGDA